MEGDHRRVGENVSRLADALAGRQGGSLWSRHEIGIGFPALELYRRTALGLLMLIQSMLAMSGFAVCLGMLGC